MKDAHTVSDSILTYLTSLVNMIYYGIKLCEICINSSFRRYRYECDKRNDLVYQTQNVPAQSQSESCNEDV